MVNFDDFHSQDRVKAKKYFILNRILLAKVFYCNQL